MKILMLVTHLNVGGITRYVLTLTQGLVRRGHEVVVVSSGGDQEHVLTAMGPRVKLMSLGIRTKSELSPRLYTAMPSLCRMIRKEKIDIIHAQTRVTQVMGTLLKTFTGKPFMSTCHGFFKKRLSRLLWPAWGQAVIAISGPVKDHLQKDFGVGSQAVRLIPNGIDLQEFVPVDPQERQARRQARQLGEGPVVGILARLSSVKGIDVLIRALPKVLKKFPQAKLVIIGTGKEEENLRRLAEELLLDGKVLFWPILDKTAEMLSLLDVFVMPSRQEGLGLSVMEAQATGLPVVASKVGGLVDLIEDGKTGLFVPPENPELLAEAVNLLLEHPAKAAQMGQSARRNVEARFSAERMVDETLKVYEELVK